MIIECKLCKGRNYFGMSCVSITGLVDVAPSSDKLIPPFRREIHHNNGVVTKNVAPINCCPAFLAAKHHDRGSGRFELFLVKDENLRD